MTLQAKDFDYELPEAQIAQRPPPERAGARLLCLERDSGARQHCKIPDLPGLLPPRTLLIANDTLVFPARLRARRQSGGDVELLLLERLAQGQGPAGRWKAMLRVSKTLRQAEVLELSIDGAFSDSATAVIETAPVAGRAEVTISGVDGWDGVGATPLPPYIRREADAADVERYQTIYASREGSVAAPTAGLHLSRPVLQKVAAANHQIELLTLHVGPGTFVPVRADAIEDHQMEVERYDVPSKTAAAIEAARQSGRAIIAVGTTTVRALEASEGRPGPGSTDLFIRPGHEFSVVDGLLTNFHLPRSTLLMLVSALAGREPVLAAYREAVSDGYRFYSYGDAMLIR